MNHNTSWVTYFISNGYAVKIGRAHNVHERLKSLQSASHTPLQLLRIIEGDHEKHYHQLYASSRLQGEWFSLSIQYYFWLITQIDRDDYVGDFARDAVDFIHFPKDENDYYEIMNTLSHYTLCRICREARIGHAQAYREWLQIRRRWNLKTGFVGRYQRIKLKYGRNLANNEHRGSNC